MLAPGATIEARHTVGLVDAISAADLRQSVGDGLPETLEQVVAHYGHRYFKLKEGYKKPHNVVAVAIARARRIYLGDAASARSGVNGKANATRRFEG